jgi:hypothetical protein
MEYALEERIGEPEYFTGRNEELVYFLDWINGIKRKRSKSTAILARRKMGKTALMERLFNITFYKNDGVIPFYYEIKEQKMKMVNFCVDFFMTFIYQYIAFKTRKPEYLTSIEKNNYEVLKKIINKEGLDFLSGLIDTVEKLAKKDNADLLWETVRLAPHNIAINRNEFIVQMMDEFQFINAFIYRDNKFAILEDTMAGGYLSTSESKVAPLLVSGSWVGWLVSLIQEMLPTRFWYHYLGNMPEEEAIEMVFNYSLLFDFPVSDETAFLIAKISEGNPFYISSIIQSRFSNKDLTSIDSLTNTLEFEILNNQGSIKTNWMEYIASAFSRVNDKNAKSIVLYLCKNRDREITREELMDDLKLDMTDLELEVKLKALVKADIINQGSSNFDYQGVQDNIFDKVFRGVYEKEIQNFDPKIIGKELKGKFEKLKKKFNQLSGIYNYQKGMFAEYAIKNKLIIYDQKKNILLKSITSNLPEDFNFTKYSRVWKYNFSPEYSRDFNVDIFACSINPEDYSIIFEIKNRESRKFSKDEVTTFENKIQEVKKNEKIERAVGFIFSRCGFTKEAKDYCLEKGIAFSENLKWLEI